MAQRDEWHLRSDREYRGLISKFWCLVLVGPLGVVGYFAITTFLAAGAAAGSSPEELSKLGLWLYVIYGVLTLLLLVYGLLFPWGLIKLYRAHQLERDWILLQSLEEQIAARQASVQSANLLREMRDSQ